MDRKKTTHSYEKPVYIHSRMAYIVKRDDGVEHMFDPDEEQEAWSFYRSKLAELAET